MEAHKKKQKKTNERRKDPKIREGNPKSTISHGEKKKMCDFSIYAEADNADNDVLEQTAVLFYTVYGITCLN